MPRPSFTATLENRQVEKVFNWYNGAVINGPLVARVDLRIKMNKKLLLALPLLVALAAPATAQTASDARPGSKQVAARPYVLTAVDNELYEEKKKKSANENKGLVSRVASAPKKALGVTCGVAVGVPVRIARDTRKYTESMRKSMVDGIGVDTQKPDLIGHMFATGCAIPFGIGSGLVHGSVKGFQNGVAVGKEKPFSKDSMGLGAQTDE